VRAFASPDATIVQGIAYEDDMADDIRVTVVATGLGRNKKPMHLIQTPHRRTGTHDVPLRIEVPEQVPAHLTSTSRFDGLDTPAVWRSGRDSATDTVRALEKNGMETYDIPAFLRRQAD
jgi:cell division protein FtsZ